MGRGGDCAAGLRGWVVGVNEKLRAQLIRDEGVVAHAYQDSRGFWTIGVGHLIDERKGGSLPQAIIDDILDYDIEKHANALIKKFPWVTDLDPIRQAVLVNMAFNLGVDGLAQFTQTLAAVRSGDYESAFMHMLNSAWATQVGIRATRLATQMRTGEWQ